MSNDRKLRSVITMHFDGLTAKQVSQYQEIMRSILIETLKTSSRKVYDKHVDDVPKCDFKDAFVLLYNDMLGTIKEL